MKVFLIGPGYSARRWLALGARIGEASLRR